MTHRILDQRAAPSISMIGLLVVEMIVGYEWLISGLVKLVRGDFPAGLAATLLEKLPKTPAWYGSFLTSAIIPNATYFGVAIEIAEFLAGVVLIVGPLIALFAWDTVPHTMRRAVLFFTAVATLGGAFLAINLHVANAASHPWLFPDGSFDEGVDLDSVLPALQLVIAWVSIVFFRRLGSDSSESVGMRRRSVAARREKPITYARMDSVHNTSRDK